MPDPLPDPTDSAADLWGRPARPPVICPGCGYKAEPYRRKLCFLCATAGPKFAPHTPGRTPAQPPAGISPMYTPVSTGGR